VWLLASEFDDLQRHLEAVFVTEQSSRQRLQLTAVCGWSSWHRFEDRKGQAKYPSDSYGNLLPEVKGTFQLTLRTLRPDASRSSSVSSRIGAASTDAGRICRFGLEKRSGGGEDT
jgi:hypothetical protein